MQALIWIALHIKKTEDAKFVMQPLFFILREQRAQVCGCSLHSGMKQYTYTVIYVDTELNNVWEKTG